MLNDLVKLADDLDKVGLHREASFVDKMIKQAYLMRPDMTPLEVCKMSAADAERRAAHWESEAYRVVKILSDECGIGMALDIPGIN